MKKSTLNNRYVLTLVVVLGLVFGQDFVQTVLGPAISILGAYVPAV